jgi:hypothetical protein
MQHHNNNNNNNNNNSVGFMFTQLHNNNNNNADYVFTQLHICNNTKLYIPATLQQRQQKHRFGTHTIHNNNKVRYVLQNTTMIT